MRRTFTLTLLALPFAFSLASAQQPQPEEQHFHAFSVVTASGKVTRGSGKDTLEASMAGPFFVETDEGPIHSGKIACTGTAEIDAASARTKARGACLFTAEDGATSSGQFECEGYSLIGCRGSYKVTGGSGRLSDLTGQAVLVWRPTSSELKAQMANGIIRDTTGLLMFRDFRLIHGKK